MRAALIGIAAAMVAAVMAGAAGCSSKSSGGSPTPNPLGFWTGSGNSPSFTVRSAIFIPSVAIGTTGLVTVAAGALSDAPDLCANLTADQYPPNAHAIELGFGDFSGTSVTPPTQAGTFNAYTGSGTPPANLFLGTYLATGPTCTVTSSLVLSGAIDLTTLGTETTTEEGSGTTLGMQDGTTAAMGFTFTYCAGIANLNASVTCAN